MVPFTRAMFDVLGSAAISVWNGAFHTGQVAVFLTEPSSALFCSLACPVPNKHILRYMTSVDEVMLIKRRVIIAVHRYWYGSKQLYGVRAVVRKIEGRLPLWQTQTKVYTSIGPRLQLHPSAHKQSGHVRQEALDMISAHLVVRPRQAGRQAPQTRCQRWQVKTKKEWALHLLCRITCTSSLIVSRSLSD